MIPVISITWWKGYDFYHKGWSRELLCLVCIWNRMEYKGALSSKSHFFHLVNNRECLHSLLLSRKSWELVGNTCESLRCSRKHLVFLYSLEILFFLYPGQHVLNYILCHIIFLVTVPFKNTDLFILWMYGCVDAYVHMDITQEAFKKSEDNFLELFFFHMGPRDWTQTIGLGD